MKTEEDEAFDELARRQGDWGGGFPAKRAMAAAKLQDGKCKLCIGGCAACDARAQPAQELIYKITVTDNAHPKGIPFEDWVQPTQDVDYWIREATAARQAEMAMRRELEAQPAQHKWVGLTVQERNDCLVSADPCECLADPEAHQLMVEVEAKLRSKNT